MHDQCVRVYTSLAYGTAFYVKWPKAKEWGLRPHLHDNVFEENGKAAFGCPPTREKHLRFPKMEQYDNMFQSVKSKKRPRPLLDVDGEKHNMQTHQSCIPLAYAHVLVHHTAGYWPGMCTTEFLMCPVALFSKRCRLQADLFGNSN